MSNIITKLKELPNELILIFFDYFYFYYLYEIFSDLNQHFNKLIEHYDRESYYHVFLLIIFL